MTLSAPNHSTSYDENFVPKATPVAPSSDASMDVRPAKKADGAFRTISEVADDLDVPQHVLRFWETKFSQVKPLKRGGGRRYYRPEDVSLLKHIHHLLYTEGYTIKGVQKLLKGQGKNQIAAQAEQMAATNAAPANGPKVETPVSSEAIGADGSNVYNISDRQRVALEEMLGELKAMRALIPQETV